DVAVMLSGETRVTGADRGSGHQSKLTRRQRGVAPQVLQLDETWIQVGGEEPRLRDRGRSGKDAVVVVREALGFSKALPSAARAAVDICVRMSSEIVGLYQSFGFESH